MTESPGPGYDGALETGLAATDDTRVADTILSGRFIFKRCPVEYWLRVPSEEENRPRALWKYVRNVIVGRKHLSWESLDARRSERQRYIKLLKRGLDGHGGFYNANEAEEWGQLSSRTHPRDLYLWRCIAKYQMRRDMMHKSVSLVYEVIVVADSINSYACDVCGEYPLASTRLTCIDCSDNEVIYTVDLCLRCFTEKKHVRRDRDGKVHRPTHNVVQYRMVEWRWYRHTIFDYAKWLLARAAYQLKSPAPLTAMQTAAGDLGESSGLSGPQCTICKSSITAPPYWICLDCEGTRSSSDPFGVVVTNPSFNISGHLRLLCLQR